MRDEGTWPAHLERMTGVPVLNGAVGGYATDQIIMRAEQPLPLVRPKTLIVGFLEKISHRSGHSSFGASKPYFTLENGGLVYHPPQHVDVEQRSRWLAEARGRARLFRSDGFRARQASLPLLVWRLRRRSLSPDRQQSGRRHVRAFAKAEEKKPTLRAFTSFCSCSMAGT